jgi:arsenate reductase
VEGKKGMTLTFFWYPNCGTCKKAKKWLEEQDISFTPVHIVENPPSKETLLELIEKSGLPAKKFFNTSGKKYRELDMKDKIKDAGTDEMAAYLASDGMLIKRPITTDGTKVTVGFKEETFREMWLD